MADLDRIKRYLDARAEREQATQDVQMMDVDDEEILLAPLQAEPAPAGSSLPTTRKRPGTRAVVQRALRQPSPQRDDYSKRLNEVYCRSRLGIEVNPENSLFDDIAPDDMASLYQRGPDLQLARNSNVAGRPLSQNEDKQKHDDIREVHYAQPDFPEGELEDDPSVYNPELFEEPIDRACEGVFVSDRHPTVKYEQFHTVGSDYHSFASALGRSNLPRKDVRKQKRSAGVKELQTQPGLPQGNEQRESSVSNGNKRMREEDQMQGHNEQGSRDKMRGAPDEKNPIRPHALGSGNSAVMAGW